jgi:predicted transcriptional regulator
MAKKKKAAKRGRPSQLERSKVQSVRLDAETLARLERLASRQDAATASIYGGKVSLGSMLRACIQAGLSSLEAAKK